MGMFRHRIAFQHNHQVSSVVCSLRQTPTLGGTFANSESSIWTSVSISLRTKSWMLLVVNVICYQVKSSFVILHERRGSLR